MYRIAIVGGGISGIAQAVRLQEALGASAHVVIYERASELGGVWRDSTWPNAGVDVAIHLYSLYSHLNPAFSEKFARRDEVLQYWTDIARRHQLEFVFDADLVESHWDDTTQSHSLTFDTKNGRVVVEADIFISAAGALNTPVFPSIPGRETFKGLQWHSSRWRDDVDLRGKRIAVVGSGSSGIQLIPAVAETEGVQLTQFMRSPGYLKQKLNYRHSALTKLAFRWVPGANRLYRSCLFYGYERTLLSRGSSGWSVKEREKSTTALLDYLERTAPREYLPILRPNYPLHCKRVAWNDGWLESLHRPNVHLTSSRIVKVTPDGLVTDDGTEHPFDVIIWATGFDVSKSGVGLNRGVHGYLGRELRQIWEEQKGATAYLAVATPHVPNYFIVLGPNAISLSWGTTLGMQSEFIARIIKEMARLRLSSIAPRLDVTEAYNRQVQERINTTVMASPACSAWYKYEGTGKVVAPSGFSATELWLKTRRIKWQDWDCYVKADTQGKAERIRELPLVERLTYIRESQARTRGFQHKRERIEVIQDLVDSLSGALQLLDAATPVQLVGPVDGGVRLPIDSAVGLSWTALVRHVVPTLLKETYAAYPELVLALDSCWFVEDESTIELRGQPTTIHAALLGKQLWALKNLDSPTDRPDHKTLAYQCHHEPGDREFSYSCVNPAHLLLEPPPIDDVGRFGCANGSPRRCPHVPKCVWIVRRTGLPSVEPPWRPRPLTPDSDDDER